eukprot:521831-Prymnesium_polylepis.1
MHQDTWTGATLVCGARAGPIDGRPPDGTRCAPAGPPRGTRGLRRLRVGRSHDGTGGGRARIPGAAGTSPAAQAA